MAMAREAVALASTTVTIGTVIDWAETNRRENRRTWAVSSASGPTRNPGVSHSESTGRSWPSHSWRNRAALSAASASIAPPSTAGSLAITPTGIPSSRTSAVMIPVAYPARSSSTLPSSANPSMTRRTS